ncbi:Ankyrin repeat-containing protein [Entamoeba marina]
MSLRSPYDSGLIPNSFHSPQNIVKSETVFDKTTPLHIVSFYNQAHLIQPVIELSTIEIDSVDSQGNTALSVASARGNTECVRVLLSLDAHPLIYNRDGVPSLFIALRHKRVEVARLLLSTCRRDVLAVTDGRGYTVIHYAVITNDTAFLNELSEMWSVDDMINNTSNVSVSTPLHIAAMFGCSNSIQWLINKGAQINIENEMGEIPLILSIKHKHEQATHILLEHSPINIPDNYGQLPIHHAASKGNFNLIKELASRYPIGMQKPDTNGNYPYHCAVESDNIDVLDIFYTSTQFLTRANSNGMTPLMLAVALEKHISFDYFIKKGASLSAKTLGGTTMFLSAVSHGKLSMVKRLFDIDPSFINDTDLKGNTAFHHAVQNRQMEIYFFDSNSFGETPLHIGCIVGNITILKKLIEDYKHPITPLTILQRSPFHYAVLAGNLDVIQYIKQFVTVNDVCHDKNKLTPLHYCCSKGMVHMIDFLVKYFPKFLNERDGCGRTPLHVAVVFNDALCVERLISHQCSTSEIDIRGLTAEQSAINRGYIHLPIADWIPVKKAEVINKYKSGGDERFLDLVIGKIINVVWEHVNGWSLGVDEEKHVGLFPSDRCKYLVMNEFELEKFKELMKKKKFTKRNIDKKE